MKRVVAFDSGAYDLYAEFTHKSMKREEFHLSPNKDALNKIIDFFFADNDAYYNGDAKKVLSEYDPVHFQVESYHSILISNHKTELDDRKSSIEVQLDYPIPLNNTNVEAVILPKHLAGSPTIKSLWMINIFG